MEKRAGYLLIVVSQKYPKKCHFYKYQPASRVSWFKEKLTNIEWSCKYIAFGPYEKLQIFIWKLQLGRWVHTKYTLIFFTCLLPLFHNQYYRTFKIGFKGIIQVFDEQKILSPKSHQNSKTCLKNRHCWIPAAAIIAVTKGFPLSRVNVLASNKKGRMAPIWHLRGSRKYFSAGKKLVNCMHFGHLLFLQ